MIENLPFIGVALLFGIGLYALMFKRNLIKMAIGVSILGSGVNLFLIALGYRADGIAPIFTGAPAETGMVLPAPQALTLTSIVISLAVIALMLSLAIMMFKHHGTLNSEKAKELKE